MAHIEQKNDAQYICIYCAGKFRKGLMPAYCILNNLFTHDVPEVILSLNTFEKILIQELKHFKLSLKWELLLIKSYLKGKWYKKLKVEHFIYHFRYRKH